MQNYNEILEKIKDILSQELGNKKIFDKDVALSLDIKYDIFRKNKQHNKIPYSNIMQFLAKRNISINYFFFNQLPETLIEPTSKYIILKYYSNVSGSAGTGTKNYQIDQEAIVIDIQILNYINSNYKYTELIKAQGDSMLPTIQNNCLIFVDRSIKEIYNKGIYVINVAGELYIKQIIRKENIYILKSFNKDYTDIKVKDLVVIGKVKGVLNSV